VETEAEGGNKIGQRFEFRSLSTSSPYSLHCALQNGYGGYLYTVVDFSLKLASGSEERRVNLNLGTWSC